MYAQLASSFLGGGDKGSQPSSTASESGDASSGLKLDFTSNNAFNLGGSGTSSQSANANKDQSAGNVSGNNVVLYVALGIAGLAVISTLWLSMRKA